MEVATDTPPAPSREVHNVAVGPVAVFSPDNAVALTPALEAALRRHYERGRERELAAPSTGAPAFPWPSRFSSWQEYINQALHDWLYGPAAVWEPGEDLR